jgi:pimeloyl-ACP methyl ester carboxylesterase
MMPCLLPTGTKKIKEPGMYVNPIPDSPPEEPTAPETEVDYSVYFLVPEEFVDATNTANGQPTGRLNPDMRQAAQLRDGNQILMQVASRYTTIYSDNSAEFMAQPYLTGMTQFAVTGANAFAACPAFPSAAIETWFTDHPQVQAATAQAIIGQMESDYNTAATAVRNTLAGANPALDRADLGWIAVSGEDDPPDFPVNVRTAPYPQYHSRLDVPTSDSSMIVNVRYIVASHDLPANPDEGPSFPAGDEVIVFIHGEGSRAEEALDFIRELLRLQEGTGRSFTVVSLDLPGCGYTTRIKPAAGEDADAPPTIDSVPHLEVAPLVTPSNILGFETGDSHSLGGHMALRLAGSDSDWVNNIVAWSPASVWDHSASIGEPVAVTVAQPKLTDIHLINAVQQTMHDIDANGNGVLQPGLVDEARADFINSVFYQNTFPPPGSGPAAVAVLCAGMALSGEFLSIAGTIGPFSGWFGAAIAAIITADLSAGFLALPTVPPQPLM